MIYSLVDFSFSYKHCYFSSGCLLVKMASKTVTIKVHSRYTVSLQLFSTITPETQRQVVVSRAKETFGGWLNRECGCYVGGEEIPLI